MKKTPADPLADARFADLIAELRAQPAPEPPADFTRRVCDRVRAASAPHGSWAAALWRVAAALAVLAGASWWLVRAPTKIAAPAGVPTPLEILMAGQQADGRWVAGGASAHSRYDTGVTALALLALMQAVPEPLDGPYAAAIRGGIAHLEQQQRQDGRFSADFSGAAYTQYLAGMAMTRAAQLPGANPEWMDIAARAQAHLPPPMQMARLNHRLAHLDAMPKRWLEAGGPSAHAALQLLSEYPAR